jgi:hypothetical protein
LGCWPYFGTSERKELELIERFIEKKEEQRNKESKQSRPTD